MIADHPGQADTTNTLDTLNAPVWIWCLVGSICVPQHSHRWLLTGRFAREELLGATRGSCTGHRENDGTVGVMTTCPDHIHTHSAAEVVAMLGHGSELWLTRQAKAGKVPGRKIAGRWRFTDADIMAMLDGFAVSDTTFARTGIPVPTARSRSARQSRR